MDKIKLLVLTAALFLVSCNEVPEDVRSREEERQGVISQAEMSEHPTEAKLISTNELQADVENALSGKYRNFILADGIKVELPTEYAQCSFTQVTDFDSNAEALAEKFFSSDEISKIELKKVSEPAVIASDDPEYNADDDPNIINCRSYRDEEQKLHISVWDNGFCCLIKPSFFDTLGADGIFYKLYHVDRSDDLSDTYTLGDKEVSVKEAADSAQKWVDDNYARFEPDYKFRVKTVIVKYNDLGEYMINIRLSKSYKGIYLDELREVTDSSIVRPDGQGKYFQYVNTLNYLEIQMKTDCVPEYFSNSTGTLIPKEEKTLSEVVPLSSALGLIEEKFSDFNEPYIINDINLKYMLYPEYDFKSGIFYNTAGNKYSARIVWEFVIDVPQEQGSTNNDVRRFICVDAETGEISFEFELSKLWQ